MLFILLWLSIFFSFFNFISIPNFSISDWILLSYVYSFDTKYPFLHNLFIIFEWLIEFRKWLTDKWSKWRLNTKNDQTRTLDIWTIKLHLFHTKNHSDTLVCVFLLEQQRCFWDRSASGFYLLKLYSWSRV